MSTTPPTPPPAQTSYWNYIRVEELLALQGGIEQDEEQLSDDEVLFIVVHQVYELWFKLALRELRSLRDLLVEPLAEERVSDAVHSARRVSSVFRRAVDHFEVVESLRTNAYLNFRDKLSPASGFQSAQMREMELVLGLRDEDRVDMGAGFNYREALRSHDGSESPALARVEQALDGRPTLLEAVDEWLYRTPIGGAGPGDAKADEALDAFIARYSQAHADEVERSGRTMAGVARDDTDRARLAKRFEAEVKALADFFEASGDVRRRRIRAAILLIVGFSDRALLAWPNALLEALVELEQQMVIFRQRHARMVERVIGRRTGTGGSSGVDYLDQTAAKYRVFRDLWAVRTFQIRAEAAPELEREAFYGFQSS